ncbi:MAG: hypothetical protein AAFR61_12765 [Bacteroidota bacterium]
MTAHLASLINAITLITLGGWGYLASASASPTALIPVGVGIVLFLCNPGLRKENKVIAHVAVLLTFLILFGLVVPLMGGIERADNMAVIRVVVMMLTTVMALVYFVRSFMQARKNREAS